MDRNLALEFVRVTEAAAIAAAKWIGKGDKNAADGAAVEEMRARFNLIDFRGVVVIGEGEKDEAPELYNGEKVGKGGGPEMDLAIDPLECTESVAHGRYNAMSVIVTGPKGSLLKAPDTYMDKIAVGPEAAKVINIDAPVKINVQKTAKALGKKVDEITVAVLDRPRHEPLIQEIRSLGARVRIFTDGDVAAAIATCLPDNPTDMLLGIGGSTEAVLAAAAVKTLGGQQLCRFKPLKDRDHEVLKKFNVTDISKVYSAEDLAKGSAVEFTATGIIEGPLLEGVVFNHDKIITHSLVIRAKSKTIRYIKAYHHYHSV